MSYDLLRFSLLFRRFVTVKADDSVPPFFIESEFRTLHLFRAPPSYNPITKPNRPTLRVGRPKARRQNVRVLSRRSNLPKAVACGYSEGAGFVVLTEPSPSLLPCPSAPHLGDPSTRRREVCPRRRGRCVHSAVLGWATNLPLAHTSLAHQQRPRRRRRALTTPPDGVGRVGSQPT